MKIEIDASWVGGWVSRCGDEVWCYARYRDTMVYGELGGEVWGLVVGGLVACGGGMGWLVENIEGQGFGRWMWMQRELIMEKGLIGDMAIGWCR